MELMELMELTEHFGGCTGGEHFGGWCVVV